jgi:hypothetical protein
MLPLDDPFWSELRHGAGKASNVPRLLRTLASEPEPSAVGQTAEVWQDLWSSLCHQGSVYTASYAAVPHLIQIAYAAKGPIDYDFFALPTTIEIARRGGGGPRIPEAFERDYHEALARLEECVWRRRDDAWKRPMILSAAAALALSKDDVELAEALLNLTDDWIAQI